MRKRHSKNSKRYHYINVNHLRWDEMRAGIRSPFSRYEQRMIKLISELPGMGKETWIYDSYPMQLCENGAGLARQYSFMVDPRNASQTTALLYSGHIKAWDVSSNQTNVFDLEPNTLAITNGYIVIPVDKVDGRATDEERLKPATKYFILQVGEYLYGFTSLHLLNWHMEAQQKQFSVFRPNAAKSGSSAQFS